MLRRTRDEVARIAGVSTATVSRVLSGRGPAPVSEELRERVLKAADQIGYRPNSIARALVTGKTHLVAMWAQDCFTPYYSLIGRHIAQQGIRRHYQVLVNSRQHYVDDQHQALFSLPWHVDGVLVCDIESQASPVASLYDAHTPRVSLGVFHTAAQDFVGIDLYQSTVDAIHHLLSPGCRRIAYMRNNEATRARDPRTRAYEDALHEAGLEAEPIAVPNQQRPTARQAVVEYVRERGLPEAIYCINDDIALGCYRGLRDLGVRIPDDVALVGCDGLSELEYLETPISTIAQPLEAMCEQAWEFLEHRIQEPSTPIQQKTLPAQLVIRASSCR